MYTIYKEMENMEVGVLVSPLPGSGPPQKSPGWGDISRK